MHYCPDTRTCTLLFHVKCNFSKPARIHFANQYGNTANNTINLITLIKVHLTKGSAPEWGTPLKGQQRPPRFQLGDRIPCFSLVSSYGRSVQIVTQVVHTCSTIHHRITVLSKVFCPVRTTMQLVFYVTYVTTVPIVLPARSERSLRICRFSARISARLTVTLVTHTVTSPKRLRVMLLLRMLVADPVTRALAVRVTATGRTIVAATASWTRCLRSN